MTITVFACSINLLKELREDQMGTSDLELKLREENKPNFCESCGMDLITCDCVNPRPVTVTQVSPSSAVREVKP